MLSINEDSEFVYSENFFKNSFWFIFFYHTMSSWTWFRIAFTFSKWFLISFFFLFLLCFYFFHKNYYHFTKGKEPAQSPKPAVSFPLNPFLLGHGLGCYPKNPLALEVSSVSYEQIRVAFIFSKWFLIHFFLFLLCFYFFIKIIITSLKRRNQLRVRSPQFPPPP